MTSRLVRAVAALAIVASACTARAADRDPVRLIVRMTEFSFGSPLLEVVAGRPIEVELTNEGKVDHDLVLDATGTRALLRPGQRATVSIPALEAGAYAVYCSIPTHRDAGMTTTLVVR